MSIIIATEFTLSLVQCILIVFHYNTHIKFEEQHYSQKCGSSLSGLHLYGLAIRRYESHRKDTKRATKIALLLKNREVSILLAKLLE